MSASYKRTRSFRVDPFTFAVPGAKDGATKATAPQPPMTLRRIAYEIAATSIEDLRAVNAEPLASVPADTPLTEGIEVRLPVELAMRGSPYGLTLSLGHAEQQLQDCDALLDAIADTWEVECGANSLAPLPPRRVRPPTEAMLAMVHAEATRQLPRVASRMRQLGGKDTRLPFLVEVDALREGEATVQSEFCNAVAGLESFKAETDALVRPGTPPLSSNALCPASLHTTCDKGDDFCVEHTHRWEFAMHGAATKEPREVWAVLSCQPLVALLDAVDCATVRDPLHTSRNAFFFIHGTFYVDDRHRDEADFCDLTTAIRTNDPLRDETTFDAALHQPFDRCPVRSAATTTFKDLEVKMGESCLLRHCGGCDHYFHLTAVRSLRGYPRKERADFPHRAAMVPRQTRRCRICSNFPATVVAYEDPLSTCSPAFYCAVCFDVLHSCDTPEEAAQYHRRHAEDFGEKYFTTW